MSEPIIVIFAWVFIVTTWSMILIPYFLRRSDLLTAWNFFLAGSSIFIGLSVINSSYPRHFLAYTNLDYLRYCIGGIVFYSVVTLTYYKFKLPRRLSKKLFQKWPPAKPSVLFLMVPIIVVVVVVMILSVYTNNTWLITGVRYIGLPAAILGTSLAFAAWYKQIYNPILLSAFLIVTIVMGGIILQSTFGRRVFMSFFVSIPIFLYWLRWRYRSPFFFVPVTSVFVVLGLLLIMGVSEIRSDRSFTAVERVKYVLGSLVNPNWGVAKYISAQDTAECSLLAIHMYTHEKTPELFHSVYWLIANPIPRELWPEKPIAFGLTLPRDGVKLYGRSQVLFRGGNWGPGVIGQGYRDGGPVVLAIYAVFMGAFLRFIDELLIDQPSNPYILGVFSSFAGILLLWPRGDIAGMSIQIMFAILSTYLISLTGRLIYGTKVNRPSAEQGMQRVLVIRKTSAPG